MHIADNLRAGMSAGEARRQALIKLGGVEATKEAYRDQRGLPAFDTLLQDIRYGLRGLRRSPGFAFTAVLTLALGIGATTAIFSAVYALLIRPLPYRDPGRLVWVTEQQPSGVGGAIAEPDMVAWRERGRPFEAVAGYAFNEYTLDRRRGYRCAFPAPWFPPISSPFWGLRRKWAATSAADDRPGSPAVALLSDALWRERFSADPRVVGTALNLDGEPLTLWSACCRRASAFPKSPTAPQVLLALRAPGSSAFNVEEALVMFQVLARLRPGDSLADVQAELQSFQQARLSSIQRRWRAWPKDANWKSFPCSVTSREIRESR